MNGFLCDMHIAEFGGDKDPVILIVIKIDSIRIEITRRRQDKDLRSHSQHSRRSKATVIRLMMMPSE